LIAAWRSTSEWNTSAERPSVEVVVNWQLRRWRPPAPRSEWLGFDAFQTWEVVRSPET
jgi:hypothetical protein